MKYNSVQLTFIRYSETKQIIVYAEAIKAQYFELLGYLRDCIVDLNKFINKVENYLRHGDIIRAMQQ